MSNFEDFSLEQSEELIAKLKSGAPSEFEQLRSTLNLLAHVNELPPTAIPPVLPSGITQPVPVLPVKSTKPRRTIVTSVIVTGMLASASLAAAAVTGIGPAPIVNIGHQTAKFVKSVVGAVSNAVTGNSSVASAESANPQLPGVTPAPTPTDNSSNTNNDQSNSENTPLPIAPIQNLLPPAATSHIPIGLQNLLPPAATSHISHESESPKPEDSPQAKFSPPSAPGTESDDSGNEDFVPTLPTSLPSAGPTALPGTEPSTESAPTPSTEPTPASTPTGSTEPSPSATEAPSSDD